MKKTIFLKIIVLFLSLQAFTVYGDPSKHLKKTVINESIEYYDRGKIAFICDIHVKRCMELDKKAFNKFIQKNSQHGLRAIEDLDDGILFKKGIVRYVDYFDVIKEK